MFENSLTSSFLYVMIPLCEFFIVLFAILYANQKHSFLQDVSFAAGRRPRILLYYREKESQLICHRKAGVQIMRIYLVRHGQTRLNRRGCYYGLKDVPLSDHGVAQACLVGNMIGHLHFDRVISSPLNRAISTASLILSPSPTLTNTVEIGPDAGIGRDDMAGTDSRIETDAGIGRDGMTGTDSRIEIDGRIEEQHFGIFEGMTYSEISSSYPEELEAWNSDFDHYRIPQGESFRDVRLRIDSFTKDLLHMNEQNKDQTILITAHKGTFGHLLAALLGLPLGGFWNFAIEQGCYTCIDLEDGYAILRRLNSTQVEGDGR